MKVTYRGPRGTSTSIDGANLGVGESAELDEAQIRRLQDAGAELEVERPPDAPPEDSTPGERPVSATTTSKKTRARPAEEEVS
jgi:hypothetical protein